MDTSSAGGPAPHVLIGEDNRDDLNLYAEYLEGDGFRVSTAETAERIFASATSTPPDVILLDLVLDRGDGLDLVRALKADPRAAAIPIVAITAAVPRYLPEVVRMVGCAAFLAKPALPGDVARTLREVIERPQASPPTARVSGG